MFEYGGVRFHWLGHDGFRLKDDVTLYIDPFQISAGEKADIVLVTHEHFDHLSLEDIRRISTIDTIIVAPRVAEGELRGVKAKEVVSLSAGEKKDILGVTIEAVPAYNTNKFRAPGRVFHPKEDGRVGFIITMKGVRVYHAGDTDFIPEMKDLKVDVALLPVSGTYVMTAEEAAQAADEIKPKVAIPMHYGAIVGDVVDAQKFQRLTACKVQILEKE